MIHTKQEHTSNCNNIKVHLKTFPQPIYTFFSLTHTHARACTHLLLSHKPTYLTPVVSETKTKQVTGTF